jgi:hypothetical protein
MATMCEVVIAWAVGVLLTSTAIAADAGANTSVANASGAMPGDDALTCEQIYAGHGRSAAGSAGADPKK